MSERLKIMSEAETARRFLTLYDRRLGEKKFDDLLRLYPSDGMVYFKRGEAYEAIGEPDRAIEDYKLAESRFTMRSWKDLAHEGIERCKGLPTLSGTPRDLRGIWRDALYFHGCPARSQAMAGRAAIQRTAQYLVEKLQLTLSGADLNDMLSTLRPKLPSTVVDDIYTIKRHGDRAAHGQDVTIEEAEECRSAGARIVGFLVSLGRS